MPKINRDRLRDLRDEADWSTADLAEHLGMSPGSVSNVMTGQRPISNRKVHQLARLFTTRLGRSITADDIRSDGTQGSDDVQSVAS